MRIRCSYVLMSLSLLFLFLFSPGSVYASDTLSVEKMVQTTTVNSGDTVKIYLNISNPFGTELAIKVRDNNSIGGSTVDTVCQQAGISSGSGVADYMDIQAFMPGNYTLGVIEVKYTNPVTGLVEVVTSTDEVAIEVVGSQGNVFKSSTQTIMNCQFEDEEEQQQQQQESSEEEKSMMDKLKEMLQQSEEEKQQKEEVQQQEQQEPQSSPAQQKLSSSRQASSQDMQSVKDGLQKQAEEMQKQLEDGLDKVLSEDKDFKEMEESLKEDGYELDSKDVPPLKGNETNFTYDYKNDKGEKASISGNMRDGEVSDLKKMSPEDQEQLEAGLEADPEFQEMKDDLLEQGYEMEKTEFSGLDSDNKTDFTSSFKKPDGNTANITGSMHDGRPSDMGHLSDDDISNIKEALENSSEYQDLKEELESKNMSLPSDLNVEPIKDGKTEVSQGNITASVAVSGNETEILDIDFDDGRTLMDKVKYPLIFLIFLIIGVSYYLYRKREALVNLVADNVPVVRVKKINPKKDALLMLSEAEKLFEAGDMKEAYTKVSLAVRFYFRHTIGSALSRELTSTDVIRLLKNEGHGDVSKVKECFSMCDLVKFAKYKPNKKDFGKILGLGKEIVGK
ncbi:MAG: hypothetical protein GQ477_06190 [Nanohaloarchaea archaeon]|nr:hypothetical protein [Candidatus Nanohaloarchaea archaeon]